MGSNKIKKKSGSFNMAQGRYTHLYFLMPAIIIMLLVVVYPLVYEIIVSFKNVNLLNLKSGRYPFVGLDNYKSIFTDGIFYRTLGRTVIWTFINVTFHVVFGLFLAVLLNRKLPFKGIIRIIL
ncbi:MAG: hypothetical protein WCQ54_11675, partial [Clostridiaceae bacterium]